MILILFLLTETSFSIRLYDVKREEECGSLGTKM